MKIDLKHWRWILSGLIFLLSISFWFFCLPRPLFNTPYSTVVLDNEGQLLGAKIATDGQWRFPLMEKCPVRFAQAALAFEDHRFFHHVGLDPFAVIRALRQNIKSRKIVSGGSTLTMQVIRLARKSKNRNFGEKMVEALLALRLELTHSKQNILALYASHAPFGGNVIGVETAAWRYYGRSAEKLSWGEASLLAVLPNTPGFLHPGRNRELLQKKRDRLLTRLWQQGIIDSQTCALALLEPLPEKPIPLPRNAPHLVERLALENISAKQVTKQVGLWHTSIRSNLQFRAAEILQRHGRELSQAAIHNAAVLVLNTNTGAVLAYCGNITGNINDTINKDRGREVDIITSHRSTGSLLKPFLYASLLDAGELLPGTLIPDVPTQIGDYAPENFDRAYEGAVPARMALARSLNIPAVRMLKGYGVERFYQKLKDFGMTTLDRPANNYGLTLVLGGAEGSLWDLCGMYAGLAREALSTPSNKSANSISNIFSPHFLNAGTKSISNSNVTHISPVDAASAWLTFQAMAEVSRPDGEKYWRNFTSSRWVAWKTGTSFGFRDGWAIGVTPEFVVGVWVGNANGQGRPGLTGIQVAAPILFEVYNLLPETSRFPMPQISMSQILVCHASGMRAGPDCPVLDSICIPTNGLRSAACSFHHLIHLDAQGNQVHDGCEKVANMRHESWFVLPPTQEWYYRQHHSDYLPLPPWRKDCEDGSTHLAKPRSMDLIYPKWGAKIYVPIDLNTEHSRTVFEAVHREPNAIIYWHLDQNYLGQTKEFHKIDLNPEPGLHTLLLVDNKGERLERVFEVLTKESAK